VLFPFQAGGFELVLLRGAEPGGFSSPLSLMTEAGMRARCSQFIVLTGFVAFPAGLLAGPIANTPIPGQQAQVITLAGGPNAPAGQTMVAPVGATVDPTDPSRLLITDQAGQVRVFQNGSLSTTPFLDVSSQLVTLSPSYDERGLLGFAFDPNYANPGTPGFQRVWTYFTEPPATATPTYTDPFETNPTTFNNQGVIASFKLDTAPGHPFQIDPSTENVILRLDHPALNHNGGTIAFGPSDHDLYISIGDGGAANDVSNGHNPYVPPNPVVPGANVGNAQDTSIYLGKILRIDVNGTNGPDGKYGIPADNPFATTQDPNNPGQDPNLPVRPSQKEIYAWGFRNPYSFHFSDGKLLLGDVGQNNVEEVDNVVKGGNYGWHTLEGNFIFHPADGTVTPDTNHAVANANGYIQPLKEYDHDEGEAIIGGFIYHGSKFPALDGKYVFADLGTSFIEDASQIQTGHLYYADLSDGQVDTISEFQLPGGQNLGQLVKGLAEGPNGEIYVLTSLKLGPNGNTGMLVELTNVPEPGGLVVLALGTLTLRRRKRHLRDVFATPTVSNVS
jgi:glucose/arabinose dehydrogenase